MIIHSPLMLILSISCLSGHPKIKTSPNYHGATGSAEQACSTVKSFRQSLESVLVDKDVPLCADSKPNRRSYLFLPCDFYGQAPKSPSARRL